MPIVSEGAFGINGSAGHVGFGPREGEILGLQRGTAKPLRPRTGPDYFVLVGLDDCTDP